MNREQLESLHKYRLDIPEGQSGSWIIERYSYIDTDVLDPKRNYPYDPTYVPFVDVTYTRLRVHPPLQLSPPEQLIKPFPSKCKQQSQFVAEHSHAHSITIHPVSVVMSDEPYEVAAALPFVDKAYGSVLMLGLGLGVVLNMLENKTEVIKITVVENSPDVIKLVGGYWKSRLGNKLQIIEYDACTWEPTEKFDCIFHDMISSSDWDALSARYPASVNESFWADGWNRVFKNTEGKYVLKNI